MLIHAQNKRRSQSNASPSNTGVSPQQGQSQFTPRDSPLPASRAPYTPPLATSTSNASSHIPASLQQYALLVNQEHSADHQTVRQPRTKRQQVGAGVGNVNEGYPACNAVDNAVLSCYPEDDTTLLQNSWSKFIWNTNYPVFIGARYVDIHLFDAGSEEELLAWRNISTFRGSIGFQVDDAWLPTQTTWTEGQTLTHSYYFVIATRGADVNAGVTHQATFEIAQTAPPATLASQLAAAAASSSASLTASPGSTDALLSGASASPTPRPGLLPLPIPPSLATSLVFSASSDLGSLPLTFTGALSTITNLAALTSVAGSISSAQSSLSSVVSSLSAAGSPIPSSILSSLSELSTSNAAIASTESSVVSSIARTRGPSILQNNDPNSGDPFPKWAIALIVVLGFLALLAALIGIWFCLRRMRRNKGKEEEEAAQEKSSKRLLAGGAASSATTRDSSVLNTGDTSSSALEGAAAAGVIGQDMKERPVSGSYSDGTGATGRMSSASTSLTPATRGQMGSNASSAGAGFLPARTGSSASASGSPSPGVLAALAMAAGQHRSASPKTLERSFTDRADSPHGAGGGGTYEHTPPSANRFGMTNKPSQRSLATTSGTSVGGGTIAPNDAAIMADAYRNVLRKPEFPHRNEDSNGSGEGDNSGSGSSGEDHSALGLSGMNTPAGGEAGEGSAAAGILGGRAGKDREPHTPKASGTTTPMAFGDSGSEGYGGGRDTERTDSTEDGHENLNEGDPISSGKRSGRRYGRRESDEEGDEANELIRHELANEGTSVKSNVERKKPEIHG